MRPDAEIAELDSAAAVAAKAEEIYGAPLTSTGVVHVTSVWRRRTAYLTLAIGPRTPRSAHDALVLNLTRARADAILTSGRILRREPRLEHRLGGPGRVPEALAAWRREHLGKDSPPVTLVLTSGRRLDFDHPIFSAGTRAVVYTSRAGQWRLESRAADRGVEVVGVDEPSVGGAIDLLRYQFGAATISVEAGPSVSRQLYEPPVTVDELLLSVYDAPQIPAGVRGDPFLDAGELVHVFSRASLPYRVATADGEWSFQRFLR